MQSKQIPDKYTAVVLESFSGADGLRLEQRKIKELKRNEVLIKIAASPINPSDLSYLNGGYTKGKTPPVVPGIEGSGRVVASGGSLMARYLLGKKVACIGPPDGDGTWAEYMVTRTSLAIPLHRTVSLELGSMSVVNPLTAISLLGQVRKKGHKTVVLTAAASTLGMMINRLAPSQGIQVINIVRREAQELLIRGAGSSVVLNSGNPDFTKSLAGACQRYNARLAFDAVGGQLTQQLLDAMPDGSRVTVFGSLAGEPVCVPTDRFVRQDKSVDGFWLTNQMDSKGFLSLLSLWRKAQRRLTNVLESKIRARYPLEETPSAIRDYLGQMTGGKVLIVPKG